MLLSVGLYFLLVFHHCAVGDTNLKEEILQEMRSMLKEFQVWSVRKRVTFFKYFKTILSLGDT